MKREMRRSGHFAVGSVDLMACCGVPLGAAHWG